MSKTLPRSPRAGSVSCSSGTQRGEDSLASKFPEMLSLAEPSQVGSKHVGACVGAGAFPTPTLGSFPWIHPWMASPSPSWLPEHHLQLPPCVQRLPGRKSLFPALLGWECSFPGAGGMGCGWNNLGIAAERGWEQPERAESRNRGGSSARLVDFAAL